MIAPVRYSWSAPICYDEPIAMLTCVEGVYRDGAVLLLEKPEDIAEARVIVVFLSKTSGVDLRERGIDEEQAAELRWRLGAIVEDWERPEMDIYEQVAMDKALRHTLGV